MSGKLRVFSSFSPFFLGHAFQNNAFSLKNKTAIKSFVAFGRGRGVPSAVDLEVSGTGTIERIFSLFLKTSLDPNLRTQTEREKNRPSLFYWGKGKIEEKLGAGLTTYSDSAGSFSEKKRGGGKLLLHRPF